MRRMQPAPHPQIVLVAAVARNGVIGAQGGMPWRLPTDLRRFKALTMGRPVVMGRKTFDTLGRPLPGRTNIVVTRGGGPIAGAVVVNSVEEGLAEASRSPGGDTVFVIGGGEIYARSIAYADRLELTQVEADPAGDTRFPFVDPRDWEAVWEEIAAQGDDDSAAMRFVRYVRKEPETVERLRQTDMANPAQR